VSGTSLTVYFSRVVTFSDLRAEAEGAAEDDVGAVFSGGGLAGGGVEDCARNAAEKAQAAQNTAGPIRTALVLLRYIISVVFWG